MRLLYDAAPTTLGLLSPASLGHANPFAILRWDRQAERESTRERDRESAGDRKSARERETETGRERGKGKRERKTERERQRGSPGASEREPPGRTGWQQ